MAVLEAVAAGREEAGRARVARVRWRARATLVLPVAITVGYALAGWARRWAVDDAYINYRVVKQIEAGNGPVFNIGERVEVTTSTLWLMVLTVADLVSPFRLEWTAVVLELALGAFGMAAAMAGALQLARLRQPGLGAGGLVVPLGAATYLAVAATWDWATGGLENGLALGWLGGTFWAVTALVDSAAVSRWRLLATAVLAGLGLLVRPDFVPFCLGFLVVVGWVAWGRRRARSLLPVVGAALALPAVVQVFRMGYYGQLFPNTYYAKEGSRTWWAQGVEYLENFVNPYLLMIPVALTVAWLALSWRQARDREPVTGRSFEGERANRDEQVASPGGDAGSRRADLVAWRLVVAALGTAVLLHILVIVRVGGDYMHGRLLQPTWFALLLPIMAVPVHELRVPRRAVLGAVMLAWAAVAAVGWRPPVGSLINADFEGVSAQSLTPAERGAVTGVVDGRLLTLTQTIDGIRVVTIDDMQGQLLAEEFRSGLDGPPRYRETVAGSGPVRPGIDRSVVAVPAVGAIGYALPLDAYVYDLHGLGDVMVARVALDHRGTPGHEKMLPGPWAVARFVDPSVAVDPDDYSPGGLTVMLPGIDLVVDEANFEDDTAAARRALDCGELAELFENTRDPLTPGLFLGNIVDSVRLDDFRYPADPQEAEAQLCG